MIGDMEDREFGIRILWDAILNDNMSSDSAFIYALGRYLLHGGTRDDFMNLNLDDIQIMLLADEATQRKSTQDIIKVISKMFERSN